ncbi:RHS repeat-associated core domain-containing protein [Tahibacter soli]|uniref:Teneurin-like YD-shell domain-containing protein n=1 Tax=Tahibacter soli TaxID=2983605 RepID=A0A9X3YN57_9GAMM|nr:RHS repeat-associated core domain-containing protein [Tahibacter soli]MDC8013741.1 hypothetical protein [Tahibacter soli]
METRENPRGSGTQVRRIAYDDAGRPTTTTDAQDGTRRQTYDPAGNVLTRTDARANVTTLRYDARNNLVEQLGPEAGQRVVFGYDRRNNKTSERRANGRVLAYAYDSADRLTRTDDEDGLVEERVLDGDGLVTQQRDADGRRTTQTYDALHRPHTQTLPGATPRTIVTVHNIHGDLESQTDPRHFVTTHTYDTLGRRVSTGYPDVDGVAAITRTTYDKVGNVVAKTNGRGQTTTYTVNALNQRERQTDPTTPDGDFEQRWTYDALGNVLTHVDRRGVLSVTAYDKENRAIGHARDGRILDTLTRDAEGNVTMLRDALGRETRTVYDKANRKTRETRPLEAQSSWTYTPEGDIETATDADARTTSYTYTKRRYLETQTLAGETTTHAYNGSGQPTQRQRPNGKTWLFGYDDAGRLKTVEDPLDHVTTYGYDAANNRTSIEDANHRITTFAYDARNRLAGKTYPGGAAYVWKYDADGNQMSIDTPNGRTIATTYDALNRALTTTYSGAGPNEASQTVRHYDGNANVTSVAETIGGDTRTETRRYDAFDRVERVVDAYGRSVDYRYDAVGNRTHLVDHDGAETVWGYDDLNRNTAITVPGQGTTAQTQTKAGKLASITRPDGSKSEYAYDDAGRIESIAHTKAGETIASYAYRYDLNGNRIEQKETNGGTTNGEAITAYRYDDADRLDRVTEPERVTNYVLDAVGNRTRETATANGQPVSDSILGYNARDQLTSRADAVANVNVVQTYDDSGNLKTQTGNGVLRTYDYDARDRMTQMQEGANAPLTFDYDAQGMRLAKSQGTQTTKYQYDQTSLLAETNAIGNTLSRYHYSATQLIGETKAGTTPQQRHYLLDALRSPIALLTQQGAVSARTRYDAWGEVIAQQGTSGQVVTPLRDQANANLVAMDEQPVGFTGYIKDSESGLYYAKARYYDPAVARFATEDPAHGADLEPPSLHRYLYAYANPTVYVDRSGRCATPLVCRMMAYHFAPAAEKERAFQAISPNTARVAGGAMAVADTAESLVAGPVIAAATFGQAVAEQVGLASGYEATDRLGSAVDGVVRAGGEIYDQGPYDYAVNKTADRFMAIDEAGKRGDYFDQGNLVADTGITVASLGAGGGGLIRAGGKSVANAVRRSVERSEAFSVLESARQEILLQRKLDLNPDNDFKLDRSESFLFDSVDEQAQYASSAIPGLEKSKRVLCLMPHLNPERIFPSYWAEVVCVPSLERGPTERTVILISVSMQI